MSEGSFRSRGGNSEEPEGASLPPGGGPGGVGCGDPPQDDWGEELPPADDQGQGLFWCVPAGAPDLAGFAGDDAVPAIAPGPLLAGLTATVAGADGAGLAAASPRRPGPLSPPRPVRLRPDAAPSDDDPSDEGPSGGGQPVADERLQVSEFVADEVAFGLRMTWLAAANRISYARL